jgi:two-component system chemotaxis response regulator CheY
MPKKILVVDDSAIVRNVHSVILKSAGFEVVEAKNGAEAYEKALSDHFDLLIVDINTPEMDGFSLCEKIRKNRNYKNIPILIVSTEAEQEDKIKGFKAGANLYLVKPVKSETLIQNINMLLK